MWLTPNMRIRTPSEYEDPFWDSDYYRMIDLDTWILANAEDKNQIITGAEGGLFQFDVANDRLYWSDTLSLVNPRQTGVMTIAPNNVVIADGEFAYVVVPRPYQAGALAIVAGTAPMTNQAIVPIAYRKGNQVYIKGRGPVGVPGGGHSFPRGARDLSGGGNVLVEDNGKMIYGSSGDTLVLPAPAEGMYFWISCDTGSAYLILDALTYGSEFIGSYLSTFSTWTKMRVHDSSNWILMIAHEVSPSTYKWLIWDGTGKTSNDDTPSEEWYFSLASLSSVPTHAASHVTTDPIQLATNAQKGLASSAHITLLESAEQQANKDAANGYAGLDAGLKIDGTQQKYGTTSNTACEGNDPRLGAGGAAGENLTYTNTTNKVAGPLTIPPSTPALVSMAIVTGTVQQYTLDYTIREVVGGSAPGFYICISPTSSAPGGGSFSGGSNPGTGIESILTSGDVVRIF